MAKTTILTQRVVNPDNEIVFAFELAIEDFASANITFHELSVDTSGAAGEWVMVEADLTPDQLGALSRAPIYPQVASHVNPIAFVAGESTEGLFTAGNYNMPMSQTEVDGFAAFLSARGAGNIRDALAETVASGDTRQEFIDKLITALMVQNTPLPQARQ